jgi:hypothetical protein
VLPVGPGARQFSPSKDLPVGKSPRVGNIYYRQLPGYRLEVKTAPSGKLSAESQLCPWWSVNFSSVGMEWPGRLPFGGAANTERNPGRVGELLRGRRALFASREVEARYRVGAAIGIAARNIQEPRGASAPAFGASIVRKLEVTRRAIGPRPDVRLR